MGGAGEGDGQTEPLLEKLSNSSSSEIDKGTGTAWTATAHIITAVIGSGVLSLAWSVAQLGWVGGPAAMVLFAGVTLVQSSLLADCYIFHDPDNGVVRNRSYVDAVRAIQKANCYHREGHDAPCSVGGDGYYMLMFGLAQVVLSQIPGFHDMAWLSVLSAAMSFTYSLIGFGLGVAKVITNGVIKGGIGGIAMVSATQKVWRVSQAIGDIAFAYPFASVLLEIEDTLRSPPPESETMRTASRASIAVTTFFYLCCGCFGYAAFGDATPGNLLTGFGFYEPYWLIDFANLCVAVHLLGGYQARTGFEISGYSQPFFGAVDRRMGGPGAGLLKVPFPAAVPWPVPFPARLPLKRVKAVIPDGVVGLLGAFTFWPLSIHFPVEMYLVQKKVAPWTPRWLAVRAFSAACLATGAFASVGSAVGVFSSKTS
ncbi:hypothetical protein OsJ_08190 [Oryza sativa Japonica Group]|uniref:Amino acid transporter transmembrane domain-containing protein n=1 Tax=Oryza sativa subsp. japonica TaxID=39947 RepID=B9F2F6_ORYSJ|nr:hypothetical protein OsJ_08190 [Oryza sativa Japonica Group]